MIKIEMPDEEIETIAELLHEAAESYRTVLKFAGDEEEQVEYLEKKVNAELAAEVFDARVAAARQAAIREAVDE